jgi:hypothetical protein
MRILFAGDTFPSARQLLKRRLGQSDNEFSVCSAAELTASNAIDRDGSLNWAMSRRTCSAERNVAVVLRGLGGSFAGATGLYSMHP